MSNEIFCTETPFQCSWLASPLSEEMTCIGPDQHPGVRIGAFGSVLFVALAGNFQPGTLRKPPWPLTQVLSGVLRTDGTTSAFRSMFAEAADVL
jgi:hypothetical protein